MSEQILETRIIDRGAEFALLVRLKYDRPHAFNAEWFHKSDQGAKKRAEMLTIIAGLLDHAHSYMGVKFQCGEDGKLTVIG